VLHYLQDRGPTLAELRRVLTPGGRLIVSVEHPFAITLMQRMAGEKPDYFQTRNRTEEWTMGGQTAQMSFWDRPATCSPKNSTGSQVRASSPSCSSS
jgi:SAM-dependent methyltransferase